MQDEKRFENVMTVLNEFIEGGGQPNFYNGETTPLNLAVKNKHPEAVSFLITHGASCSDPKMFLKLVKMGLTDCIGPFLDKGIVEASVTDSHGKSACHIAVASGKTEMIDTLVGEGCNINAVDKVRYLYI
jgi:ankyrin repeat protein